MTNSVFEKRVDRGIHDTCPGEEIGCSARDLVRIGFCRAED